MGDRLFGIDFNDQVIARESDGAWTLIAEPGVLLSPDVHQVSVSAIGELGIIAIGYKDVPFPEIAGREPLSTARMLWFSPDGSNWHAQSVEETFGTFGAVEIAAVGDRLVAAFGAEQPEDLEVITEPAWWIATSGN